MTLRDRILQDFCLGQARFWRPINASSWNWAQAATKAGLTRSPLGFWQATRATLLAVEERLTPQGPRKRVYEFRSTRAKARRTGLISEQPMRQGK